MMQWSKLKGMREKGEGRGGRERGERGWIEVRLEKEGRRSIYFFAAV